MRNFSIKELENFSGIKAHTIRTWEKRYNIFNPKRTLSNIRHYSLEDVKLLLDISLLGSHGHMISQLAGLSPENIRQKTISLTSENARHARAINHLICCMFSAEIDDFETTLDNCVDFMGIDISILKIIIPFLERVGILSYRDTSSEAHFIVTAVRKKLILGIEKANPSANRKKTALLFLPEGEHYDLLLLYMNYIIKNEGFRVLYLGTNISLDTLKNVILDKEPDYIITYITGKNKFPSEGLSVFLNKVLPRSILCLAKNKMVEVSIPDSPNTVVFDFNEIGNALK